MLHKLHFDVPSLVDERGNFEDQHWNDEFTALMALFGKIEVEEGIYDNMGFASHLVRFKDGGYAYYEVFDVGIPDDEELKEKAEQVIENGKTFYVQTTGEIDFYISADIQEVMKKARERGYFIKEKVIKKVLRDEDQVLLTMMES